MPVDRCMFRMSREIDGVMKTCVVLTYVWGLRRYAGTAGSARSRALRNTASCRNTRAACAGACRIRYLRLRRAPYIFRYSLTHRTNVTSPVL